MKKPFRILRRIEICTGTGNFV